MTREEIAKRRDELWGQRNAIAFSCPMPIASAIEAHNRELASIDAELAALPAPDTPETGEAAGIVRIGAFLGDPWSAPPREERRDPDGDHPLLREYGDSIR